MFGTRIRLTHLGQRSLRPHKPAGHLTATNRPRRSRTNSLQGGEAVHTWIPGSPLRGGAE